MDSNYCPFFFFLNILQNFKTLIEISKFQTRGHEWIFSSEEGQWVVVDNSKTARLLMVICCYSIGSSFLEEVLSQHLTI